MIRTDCGDATPVVWKHCCVNMIHSNLIEMADFDWPVEGHLLGFDASKAVYAERLNYQLAMVKPGQVHTAMIAGQVYCNYQIENKTRVINLS